MDACILACMLASVHGHDKRVEGSYYERILRRPGCPCCGGSVRLRLDLNGRNVIWPVAELFKDRVLSGRTGTSRYGKARSYYRDRGFLDELHVYAPQFGQRVRDPNAARSIATIYGALAVALAAVILVLWLAREKIEDAVATLVPASVEERVGRAVMAQVSVAAPPCSSEPLQRAVDAILSRLAGTLDGNGYTFRVSVLDDPMVNAFAAPGGGMLLLSRAG